MICKVSKIVFLILIVSSCNTTKEQNVIAFSCIYCRGCVSSAFSYISEKDLFYNYQIVMDTTCHSPKYFNFPVHHMESKDMFKKFGRFGNFILIDSLGDLTVFNSDMRLQDYLQ